ncbi:hypothetical protein [Bacillus taeanensis]|uniref:Uncharacterized protein n=1 Tax=Bacillus taeanensis TaxID=273032 RepID=A0A366XSD6_9BACI|nr:hypothetical protein [Bacillus taeanensis]RBW68596.1 hypothetical protein DS031_15660 [Bacillus taeanensis]
MLNTKLSLQSVFALQILWLVMFFTNFLGVIGSKSELLQDIVWLGIPAIGIFVSVVCLIKKRFITLAVLTIALSFSVLFFWVLVTGITQM